VEKSVDSPFLWQQSLAELKNEDDFVTIDPQMLGSKQSML
jgi:hypothetical protein